MLKSCVFFILYFGKPKIDSIFATKKKNNINKFFIYAKEI